MLQVGLRQGIQGLRGQPIQLLLLAVLMAPAATAYARAQASTGWAQMQGAHVVSGGTVEVAVSPTLAFAVLTDYDRMTDFLPDMLVSEVVSRQGSSVVVEQAADEGIFLFRQRVEVRLAIHESPPSRLSFRALAGSFKEMAGSYVVTRSHDLARIEYRARFIPDFHLPPVIGLFAVQRSLERHLDALADEMRRRSVGMDAPLPPKAGASGPRGE